jgi:hypothetical protein
VTNTLITPPVSVIRRRPRAAYLKENKMIHAAKDLIDLLRLAQHGAGTLTQHLLRESMRR